MVRDTDRGVIKVRLSFTLRLRLQHRVWLRIRFWVKNLVPPIHGSPTLFR